MFNLAIKKEMANNLDVMDLKQIISLHIDGLSNRKIGETLGISRNTVNEYLRQFNASDLSMKALLELSNEALLEMFSSRSTINNSRFTSLIDYFDQMNASRHHPGFTFFHHYQHYKATCGQPYSYTQFMAHYNRKYAHQQGSMKLDHPPGHELYVDYAGKKLEVVDPTTGEIKQVEVFVATLPYSQYTYVEACESQKREDFIKCLANALQFFAGVPKAIVSDNLKSAVNRSSKYEADINRAFKDFARHYDCAINPTRAYAPQDKALVENAVQLTYQRIYYPIRNMKFFSLQDLNSEISKQLEGYNDVRFQRRDGSRKELFQSVEKGHLKELPSAAYQIKEYSRAKVQKMGYVYFSADKTYYSVPYRYIGCQTQIQYTADHVEVYHNQHRIALHDRIKTKGSYVTNEDHLSSTHKAYSQWNPGHFIEKAKKTGKNVELFMTGLFQQGDYPEINYKRAVGILQFAKSYGNDRLDKACLMATYYDAYSYKMIKNILENNMDIAELEADNNPATHIPFHDNTRGADYFE